MKRCLEEIYWHSTKTIFTQASRHQSLKYKAMPTRNHEPKHLFIKDQTEMFKDIFAWRTIFAQPEVISSLKYTSTPTRIWTEVCPFQSNNLGNYFQSTSRVISSPKYTSTPTRIWIEVCPFQSNEQQLSVKPTRESFTVPLTLEAKRANQEKAHNYCLLI